MFALKSKTTGKYATIDLLLDRIPYEDGESIRVELNPDGGGYVIWNTETYECAKAVAESKFPNLCDLDCPYNPYPNDWDIVKLRDK